MATYGVYNFSDRIKDSNTDEIILTFTDENDDAINLTGITALMQIRRNSETGKKVKEFAIDSGLTLTDAENGKIKIDSFLLDFDAGVYHYDLKMTFSDETIKTYLRGTIKVIQNTTHDC